MRLASIALLPCVSHFPLSVSFSANAALADSVVPHVAQVAAPEGIGIRCRIGDCCVFPVLHSLRNSPHVHASQPHGSVCCHKPHDCAPFKCSSMVSIRAGSTICYVCLSLSLSLPVLWCNPVCESVHPFMLICQVCDVLTPNQRLYTKKTYNVSSVCTQWWITIDTQTSVHQSTHAHTHAHTRER